MSTLSKIKTLLLSSDEGNVVLATELLINLCDPEIVVPMLKPFRYRKNKIMPPPLFRNKSLPTQQLRAYLYVLSAYADLSSEVETFCESVSELTVQKLDSFEKLCGFVKLRKLSLYGLSDDLDISDLSLFEELTELEIFTAPEQDDLSFVADLPNLKNLKLVNWPDLTSLEPLRAHPSLERITLLTCQSLNDAGALSSIATLKTVQAIGCPQLTVP